MGKHGLDHNVSSCSTNKSFFEPGKRIRKIVHTTVNDNRKGFRMNIEKIDKNFKQAKIGDTELHFYDATKAPFSLEGFPWRKEDETGFFRLPRTLTKNEVNEGALYLCNHTTGGAIRFRSNSNIIAIRAKLKDSSDMNHMPRAGSAGFDLYRGGCGKKAIHFGTAQPCRDQEILEVIMANTNDNTTYDWIVNMPLYGGAETVEIGIAPGAILEAPTPHKIKKPILFYGSSITQGGCASRPGNCYSSMLCRTLDAPQVNLGFSGSGRGEPAVAKAIAELDLAAFVMDYDHNAPSVEHLKATHENFFRIIREAHPELPIIIMSKCDIWPEVNDANLLANIQRRDIIETTYRNAKKSGDKNVYFIDGATLFGRKNRWDCTVDRCHPNDLGFYRMYKNVLPVLKEAIKK